MTMTVRVADAHKALVEYVNDGIEFPDAETRVCSEFNLTQAQVAEVRDLYDNGDRLVIIHNEIHQILVDISEEQGWNEESQIFHLCGFVQHMLTVMGAKKTITERGIRTLTNYLQAAADEENEGVEAVCEKCGEACEYDSTLCLCKFCITEAASK